MYLDKQLMFDESESAITASRASTNVIDLGSADAGKTEWLDIFARVTEAFNNLTSLGIKLQTATDAAFTTPVDLPAQETITLASGGLAINKEVLRTLLPKGCLRYVRLYYTVTGTAPTTGKITAGLVLDRQTNP
jgi:hypothetical protein